MPNDRQFNFNRRPARPTIVSESLVEAREALLEEIEELGKKAFKEAQQIEDLAKELKGDPWESVKYRQAHLLMTRLYALKSVLDNTYNQAKFAKCAEDRNIPD